MCLIKLDVSYLGRILKSIFICKILAYESIKHFKLNVRVFRQTYLIRLLQFGLKLKSAALLIILNLGFNELCCLILYNISYLKFLEFYQPSLIKHLQSGP